MIGLEKNISEILNRKIYNADQNNTNVFSRAFSLYFMKKIDLIARYMLCFYKIMYTALCSAQCKFWMANILQPHSRSFSI